MQVVARHRRDDVHVLGVAVDPAADPEGVLAIVDLVSAEHDVLVDPGQPPGEHVLDVDSRRITPVRRGRRVVAVNPVIRHGRRRGRTNLHRVAEVSRDLAERVPRDRHLHVVVRNYTEPAGVHEHIVRDGDCRAGGVRVPRGPQVSRQFIVIAVGVVGQRDVHQPVAVDLTRAVPIEDPRVVVARGPREVHRHVLEDDVSGIHDPDRRLPRAAVHPPVQRARRRECDRAGIPTVDGQAAGVLYVQGLIIGARGQVDRRARRIVDRVLDVAVMIVLQVPIQREHLDVAGPPRRAGCFRTVKQVYVSPVLECGRPHVDPVRPAVPARRDHAGRRVIQAVEAGHGRGGPAFQRLLGSQRVPGGEDVCVAAPDLREQRVGIVIRGAGDRRREVPGPATIVVLIDFVRVRQRPARIVEIQRTRVVIQSRHPLVRHDLAHGAPAARHRIGREVDRRAPVYGQEDLRIVHRCPQVSSLERVRASRQYVSHRPTRTAVGRRPRLHLAAAVPPVHRENPDLAVELDAGRLALIDLVGGRGHEVDELRRCRGEARHRCGLLVVNHIIVHVGV